jgi:hypothetical protein
VRGVLAQRKAEASAQSSQSAVVRALLTAKSRGEVRGIHGRLGACTACALRLSSAFHPLCWPFHPCCRPPTLLVGFAPSLPDPPDAREFLPGDLCVMNATSGRVDDSA